MAEPQLQPDELDRLEDALEDLELGDLIDDPSPLVRSRLADYRVVLMAAREAMPMVDVPPGVLAGVLAEARRADDELLELSAAPDGSAPKQEESWWSRVRKSFLIPSLAVVGTAALILIIVQPTMSDAPTSDDVGVVASAERAPEKEQTIAPDPAAAPPPAAVAPEPEAPAEEEAEDAPLYEIATAKRPGPTSPGTAKADLSDESAVGGKDALEGGEEGEAQVADAEERKQEPGSWEAIERGDKARLGGDCFSASNEYHRALDDGNDSVRARAYVGLALCASQDGNTSKADSYFEQARALDPEVGGYIDTQRNDDARKSRKAAPRKKENSKRKAAMPSLDSQGLPGDAVNSTPYKK